MSSPLFAPCPFCGSRDLQLEELDVKSWGITCHDCKTIGPFCTDQDPLTALHRWNIRPRAGFRASDRPETITLGDPA